MTTVLPRKMWGLVVTFVVMCAIAPQGIAAGSAYANQWVQKAYVAYYGRPADPSGLTYWAARMDREGGSLSSIIAAFGTSDEFNRRYGNRTYGQLIDSLYLQALGRAPDAAGKGWYLSELTAGRSTLQTIALDLLGGATGADASTVANRLDVANYYTGQVAAGCDYGGETTGVNALMAVGSNPTTVLAAAAVIDSRCALPGAQPTSPGGRVAVGRKDGAVFQFPPENQSWRVEYRFRVPPLPQSVSASWNPSQNTFYVWGDLQFEAYGSEGQYPISDYKYNQIVPAAFIGRVLSANDANFTPSWTQLNAWAIQAQYFWQKGDTPYAQTGNIVPVSPGDEITTVIAYSPDTGKLTVSIAGPNGTSSIIVDRPFPNEPSLFANWADFLGRAQAKSASLGAWVAPIMSVEPNADRQTVCAVLPFIVDWISLPGVPATWTQFEIWTTNGLTCPKSLVQWGF